MTVKIDLDNVMPMLEQAVAAKGRGYRYYSEHKFCSYGDFDTSTRPACLIGHLIYQQSGENPEVLAEADAYGDALYLFGFESLSDGEYTDDHEVEYELADLAVGLPGFEVTPDAARVMREAQRVQDERENNTWGEALDAAYALHAKLVAKRDTVEASA